MRQFDYDTAEGILFTDQYQLTMAQVYFKLGLHEKQAHFDHYFREYPNYGIHKAGYCINAGLEWFLDWMHRVAFRKQDIDYLRSQKTSSGKPVFEEDFLIWLRKNGRFEHITMYAIPEGRVIHPNVPVTIIQGPMALTQILETALLNQLNYQILIATKASRMNLIARDQLIMEFGARRGQDRGAIAGARAALIGGANFTSNVGISHILGYQPQGTHSHSMIQLFLALGMTELDAFRTYSDIYPENCILLVDTINTLESGIPNAIKVFEELRKKGYHPLGIRLDSGDLAHLSIQAAKILDKAGFEDTLIVLSNELDELNIWQIITQIVEEGPQQGIDTERLIKRLGYGIGTRLITSAGHSALGGVYKLVAVYNEENWVPVIKVSENIEKTPNPGNKRVWRIYDQRNKANVDLISLEDENIKEMDKINLRHANIASKHRMITHTSISEIEPLLVNIINGGKLLYDLPDIEQIRKVREYDIERLDSGVKRLLNPHISHVSITEKLWRLKQTLINSALQ